MQNFRVTTLENFDSQTKSFKNSDFIGTCIKVENISVQKINQDTMEVETNLITLCTVLWDNQGSFYPATIAYPAEQLVFIGKSDQDALLSEMISRISDLEERISEIEDDIYEDEDEDESDEIEN